jgi:hypothetical protein
MNKFIYFKLDTIETSNFLKQNSNFWHMSLEKNNFNYSIELEEFFNNKKFTNQVFNIGNNRDATWNKKIILNTYKEKIKKYNVINKIINLEKYMNAKNSLYVCREANDYTNRLLRALEITEKNNTGWKYDKILEYCKVKFNVTNSYEAFYLSAQEEHRKIIKKCNKEGIDLIFLKAGETLDKL